MISDLESVMLAVERLNDIRPPELDRQRSDGSSNESENQLLNQIHQISSRRLENQRAELPSHSIIFSSAPLASSLIRKNNSNLESSSNEIINHQDLNNLITSSNQNPSHQELSSLVDTHHHFLNHKSIHHLNSSIHHHQQPPVRPSNSLLNIPSSSHLSTLSESSDHDSSKIDEDDHDQDNEASSLLVIVLSKACVLQSVTWLGFRHISDASKNGLVTNQWRWASEEQVWIGKLTIWLWYDGLSDFKLSQENVNVQGINNIIIIEVESEKIEIDVGVQVKEKACFVQIKGNNTIEIGMSTIKPTGDISQAEDLKFQDIFGLTTLRDNGIGEICCGNCGNGLLHGLDEAKIKWFALPSEHWQEFVEYWICHEDTKLKSSNQTPNGVLRKPDSGEGFIGHSFIEFSLAWFHRIAHQLNKPLGWKKRSRQSIVGGLGAELIECSNCLMSLGEEMSGGSEDTKDGLIRFYKRAIVNRFGSNELMMTEQQIKLKGGRWFEKSIVEEIFRLLESEGVYKILIQPAQIDRDCTAGAIEDQIGIWMFCRMVYINSDSLKKRTKRTKLLYTLLPKTEPEVIQAWSDDSQIGKIELPNDQIQKLKNHLDVNQIERFSFSSVKEGKIFNHQKWLNIYNVSYL
ncbi:hypothetical protein O181_047208 [Austropuccinia psidii MF-1]|uniref:HECT domain-containing protein n=1 Tax=Austropuccinia psidii MF-1 TaxID=1389203 RepID=A0A9Q3DVK5_9BASI|nr:hypothetical protein [Austropuccinia psidii MF-1]